MTDYRYTSSTISLWMHKDEPVTVKREPGWDFTAIKIATGGSSDVTIYLRDDQCSLEDLISMLQAGVKTLPPTED